MTRRVVVRAGIIGGATLVAAVAVIFAFVWKSEEARAPEAMTVVMRSADGETCNQVKLDNRTGGILEKRQVMCPDRVAPVVRRETGEAPPATPPSAGRGVSGDRPASGRAMPAGRPDSAKYQFPNKRIDSVRDSFSTR